MPTHPRLLLLLSTAMLIAPLADARESQKLDTLANQFVASLTEAQQKQLFFPLPDPERTNWHYVPYERAGLPIKSMSPEQRDAAFAFLGAALSDAGLRKAKEIMVLESVLAVLEDNPVRRDSEKYYFSIFGKPSATGAWAWRFEGHHLSMNFTIVDGKTTYPTPSFLGANPGEVDGGKHDGLRALANEEDLALALVGSLDPAQMKKALIPGKTPRDILTKEQQQAERPDDTQGIPLSELDENQAKAFWVLVEEYTGRHTAAQAAADLARFRAIPADEIRFAWSGGTVRGQPHYYRILGGDLLIEYANTQNQAKHPHAVFRDLRNDFGHDALRQHLKEAHGQ